MQEKSRDMKFMNPLRRALIAGSCASALSAITLAWCGRRENRSAAAPLNAVSHWYWGDEALGRHRMDLRHTLLGYATHHGASLFWASLLCAFLHGRPRMQTRQRLLAASAGTSAIACFVDFRLTPHRFTPGYEHRVSRPSLALTYLAFAAGLALGTIATVVGRREKRS